MADVLTIVQVVFYGLGSVALLIGTLVGLRRYLIELPHEMEWGVDWDEISLRRGTVVPDQFYHSLTLVLVNRSLAVQRVGGFWIQLYPHGTEDFGGERFAATQNDLASLRGFFDREMTLTHSEGTAPNGTVRIGQNMSANQMISVARVCYAVFGPHRRLLFPGYSDDQRILVRGSMTVHTRLEDLRVAAVGWPS